VNCTASSTTSSIGGRDEPVAGDQGLGAAGVPVECDHGGHGEPERPVRHRLRRVGHGVPGGASHRRDGGGEADRARGQRRAAPRQELRAGGQDPRPRPAPPPGQAARLRQLPRRQHARVRVHGERQPLRLAPRRRPEEAGARLGRAAQGHRRAGQWPRASSTSTTTACQGSCTGTPSPATCSSIATWRRTSATSALPRLSQRTGRPASARTAQNLLPDLQEHMGTLLQVTSIRP
jgi:hypothetical protein